LNEAPPLRKGEINVITFEVVRFELHMLMEVQIDPSPKATSLLLGAGNGIGANMQPSITKHEVLLVGVCASSMVVSLHRGQQGLIEHWLVIRPKYIYFPEHFCYRFSSNLCVLNTTNTN
jgi:hypothetical protein